MIKKNIPQTNLNWKSEIVGLFSSSYLQVTISTVSISVLKGRPKGKLGRLRDFCVPVSPLYIFSFLFLFLFIYSLTIPDTKVYRKVYIFFEERHKKANDNFFRYQ